MRLALILSDFGETMQGLRRNLAGDFSAIVGRSIAESLDLIQTLPVDLALVDLDSDAAQGADLPARIRQYRPHCTVVAVLPAGGTGERVDAGYDAVLRADASAYEVAGVLDHVMERQRLLEEIEQQRDEIRRLQARGERLQDARPGLPPVDKIVKAFSRSLSAGFDRERLLGFFADTAIEMVRVSKVSILLQDEVPGEFRVRTHRGLRPDVAEALCLRADSGLAAWLCREGRIMTRELADQPGVAAGVRREMDALQAVVSIPMLCSGTLTGILNLNARVTGSPFLDDELETLFVLAGHVAFAVEEMSTLSQMRRQQVYIEQTLAHLSSGVITIDESEQVATCNYRAGRIIGRHPADVLNRDLRRLPSPLGDMLFETMRTGRRYEEEQVRLLPAGVQLSVNTYRIEDRQGRVLGSVAVLDPVKEAEMPGAGQESLRRILGDLADEMGGPVARLAAVAESLPAAESAAWQEMAGDLRQSVLQLGRLCDKLAGVADRLALNLAVEDLQEMLRQAFCDAREEGLAEGAVSFPDPDDAAPLRVRADRVHLPRALGSLLRWAAGRSSSDRPVEVGLSQPNGRHHDGPTLAEVRIGYAAKGDAAGSGGRRPLVPAELSLLQSPGLEIASARQVIEAHGGTVALGRGKADDAWVAVCLPVVP